MATAVHYQTVRVSQQSPQAGKGKPSNLSSTRLGRAQIRVSPLSIPGQGDSSQSHPSFGQDLSSLVVAAHTRNPSVTPKTRQLVRISSPNATPSPKSPNKPADHFVAQLDCRSSLYSPQLVRASLDPNSLEIRWDSPAPVTPSQQLTSPSASSAIHREPSHKKTSSLAWSEQGEHPTTPNRQSADKASWWCCFDFRKNKE